MAAEKMLKVTLVKSTIGAIPKHKATVAALGLKKLNKTVASGFGELGCINDKWYFLPFCF